jgi:hypothetical protein
MKTTLNKLLELNFDLCIQDYYKTGMQCDELLEALNRAISEQQIIYYHVAMEFLKNNDPSLKDSLEIADSLGYSPAQLSSETLATLLHQQQLSEQLSAITSAIQDIFYEAEESNEE